MCGVDYYFRELLTQVSQRSLQQDFLARKSFISKSVRQMNYFKCEMFGFGFVMDLFLGVFRLRVTF